MGKEITIKLNGLHCASCIMSIEMELEEIKGVNCWICQKCLIQDPYNDNTKLTIINKLTKKKRCLICKMQLINKKAMIVRAKHEYEKIIEVNYYCPSCFSYS